MTNRKVCIIFGSLYPYHRGGVEVLFTNLFTVIARKKNWDVVALARSPRKAKALAFANPLPTCALPSLRSAPFGRLFEFMYLSFLDQLFFNNRLRHLMDSYFGQFDIILTPDPALTVSLCRLKTRPRILQFVSGAWADTVARSQPLLSGYARRIEAEAYRMADRVIFMDESYESLFKTEERRRALIPNGVNLDIFNPSKYNREKQRNRFEMSDKIVILAVGTLRKKIKGHEFFIGAIPSVVRNFPNAHFYLVGKGDQESLRSQSESLGIAGHLHLLGERMDIPELLSAGDVFVLPSESEGTPGALLEAMAMKLPCIATRVGNVPRVIRHELDGILIEPANSKQIADTIVHLLSNPDLAIKLADRARKRVEEHYNFRDTTQAYISLVESVLKET